MIEIEPPAPCGADETLWAISKEGVIWQINPLSRYAAPVLHLDELPPDDRQSLRHYMMQCWHYRGASLPPEPS